MLYNLFLLMISVGVLLIVLSIVFMFVFHVPDLLDELSGNKARRQIKRLKELNAGQGVLDGGVNTKDVYSVMGAGSMLTSLERPVAVQSFISDTKPSSKSSVKEVKKEEDVNNWLSSEKTKPQQLDETTGNLKEVAVEAEENTGYMDSEEVATGFTDVEDVKTGFISPEEEVTGFMDNENIMTSFIDESEVSGILTGVEEFVKNRRFVEILEEQTSLNLSKEL